MITINNIATIIAEDITTNNGLIYTEAKTRDIPLVTTVAIFRKNNGLEILLERRGKEPKKHEWALPGGHVEQEGKEIEGYREAAIREIKEETSLKLNKNDLIYVTEKERNSKNAKHDILFTILIPMTNSKIEAGSDAEYLEWTPIDQIPNLVFNHDEFIELALRKIETPEQKTPKITHNKYKTNQGILIAFEGLDGSGKTSQIKMLEKYLKEEDLKVKYTKWASSELLHNTIKEMKKDIACDPMLYSMLNSADMLLRYTKDILPWLSKNNIVLCDRYIYTSYARDLVRGIDIEILNKIYHGFRKPDIIIYCDAKPEITLKRVKKDGMSYFGSGMDLHFSDHIIDNFLEYQKRMVKAYKEVFSEIDHEFINTNRDKKVVHNEICKLVDDFIKD